MRIPNQVEQERIREAMGGPTVNTYFEDRLAGEVLPIILKAHRDLGHNKAILQADDNRQLASSLSQDLKRTFPKLCIAEVALAFDWGVVAIDVKNVCRINWMKWLRMYDEMRRGVPMHDSKQLAAPVTDRPYVSDEFINHVHEMYVEYITEGYIPKMDAGQVILKRLHMAGLVPDGFTWKKYISKAKYTREPLNKWQRAIEEAKTDEERYEVAAKLICLREILEHHRANGTTAEEFYIKLKATA